MRKIKIETRNREIYDGFHSLKYNSKSIIEGVKKSQINRIINSINKNSKVVDIRFIDDVAILKKLKPINYEVYFRTKYI